MPPNGGSNAAALAAEVAELSIALLQRHGAQLRPWLSSELLKVGLGILEAFGSEPRERQLGELRAWASRAADDWMKLHAVTETKVEPSSNIWSSFWPSVQPQSDGPLEEAVWTSERVGSRAQAFREALDRHRVKVAYHWTPARNLASILTRGILCRHSLITRRVPFEPHSYGRHGKAAEYRDYVAVSLYPQAGMISRAEEPALVELERAVVAFAGSFFAPGNTASDLLDFGRVSKRRSVADLEALFDSATSPHLRDWQAEIWVPRGIHPRFIRRVLFDSAEVRDASREACARALIRLERPPPFEWEGFRPNSAPVASVLERLDGG